MPSEARLLLFCLCTAAAGAEMLAAANGSASPWHVFQRHSTTPRWRRGDNVSSVDSHQFVLTSGQQDPQLLQLEASLAQQQSKKSPAGSEQLQGEDAHAGKLSEGKVEDEEEEDTDEDAEDEEAKKRKPGRRWSRRREPEEVEEAVEAEEAEEDDFVATATPAEKRALAHELLEEYADHIHRARRRVRRFSDSAEFGADLVDELHRLEERSLHQKPGSASEKDALWQELVGSEPHAEWQYYEQSHRHPPPAPPADTRARDAVLQELADFVAKEQRPDSSAGMSAAEAMAVRRFVSRVADMHRGLLALRDAADSASELPDSFAERADRLAAQLQPEAHAWRLDGANLEEALRDAKALAERSRRVQEEVDRLHESLLAAARPDGG